MIFINFWFHDFEIFFSFYVLLLLCQRNAFDLIIINVFKMHEKNVNKRKLIFVFLLFHKQNVFCLLCFFYCKKTLIFFIEIFLVLIKCRRDFKHENEIDDRRVFTIKFINLWSNLLLKCFRWNNYFKNFVFWKNVQVLRFCVILITNYQWDNYWFYTFI